MSGVKPGLYRHFKHGNEYTVIDTVCHSETQEAMVLYRAEYGERGLWVRPLDMFTEQVEHNGVKKPRFEYVGAN